MVGHQPVLPADYGRGAAADARPPAWDSLCEGALARAIGTGDPRVQNGM